MFKFFGNTVSGEVVDVTNESIVNVVDSNGNKYVFNGTISEHKYSLTNGTYTFKDIPQDFTLALLNGKTNKITYSVVDTTPIIIKVSYGSLAAVTLLMDYYDFTDENNSPIQIANGTFKFMRGRTYKFEENGISTDYPFKIFYNGIFTSSLSSSNSDIEFQIPSDHSTAAGDIYYQR